MRSIFEMRVGMDAEVFVVALALTAAGCKANRIREQAAEPHVDRLVAAVHPADGAMALRGDVAIQVVLGEEAAGRLPTIHLVGPAKVWTPACSLGAEGLWVSCAPLADLPRDEVLDLSVGFRGETSLTTSVSSEFPGGSPGYLFTSHAKVTRFGGEERTAQKVGELFQCSDMVVVIDGYDGQPGDYTLLGGLVEVFGEDPASVREPGLTFVQDVVVRADGTFASRPQNSFLPVYIDTEFVQILIQECTISGQIQDGRIAGLKMEGTIPAISLVQMAEPLGALADAVLGKITLDEDTDGDGEMDAAGFNLLAGESPQIDLVQH